MRSRAAIALAVLLVAGMSLGAQRASSRKTVMLPGATSELPYSNGVLAGNTLYLAGVIGVDPATSRPPDDLEAEIRFALDRMKTVLGQEGMTMDDLVTVQVFCSDLTLYGKFNDVYRTYFTKDFPARAFLGAGSLLRGGHFEIQGIAVKR